MFLQRVETVNIEIEPQQQNKSQQQITNWGCVQNEFFKFLSTKQTNNNCIKKQNFIQKLASENYNFSFEDSSIFDESNILNSTPVVSVFKDGSFRRQMSSRISCIPKRTPLQLNRTLMNKNNTDSATSKRSKNYHPKIS